MAGPTTNKMKTNIFKWYPEILVYFTFLLMGTFFGYVMNFYALNRLTLEIYRRVCVYPYFVGIFAALVTGGVMGQIKFRRKRFIFEHFYFITFGVASLFISGLCMLKVQYYIETYIGFVGHGVCYVAGLSYINIRIAKTSYRFVKLSIPHLMYLTGVGIASYIVHLRHNDKSDCIEEIGGLMGGVISFIAFILLAGYFSVEVLQANGRCVYKASLDEDITLENNNETIFEHKYFPFGDDPNNELCQIDAFNVQTEYSHILYAIFSKCITFMHFYYPFFMITRYVSNVGVVLMAICWLAIFGLILSMIVLPFFKYKLHFAFACGLKVVALLAASVVFGEADDLDDLKIFFSFYAISAYGYSFPDINILSYANLKYNEIMMAVGYTLEYTIIGVVQYYTLCYKEYMLDYSNYLCLMLSHSSRFIIIIFMVGIMGIFKIPNGKVQKSLFELKNNLYNEKMVVREYSPISYPHSDTASQIQLINSSLTSSCEEFQQQSQNQLYRDQQMVVQKRVNHVLDEQEAGGSGGQSILRASDRKIEMNIESYNYKVGGFSTP